MKSLTGCVLLSKRITESIQLPSHLDTDICKLVMVVLGAEQGAESLKLIF